VVVVVVRVAGVATRLCRRGHGQRSTYSPGVGSRRPVPIEQRRGGRASGVVSAWGGRQCAEDAQLEAGGQGTAAM